MTPFVIRGGFLWAFQDLRDEHGPFAHAVASAEAEQHVTAEWYGQAQHLGWYVALLNRCLNKLTGGWGSTSTGSTSGTTSSRTSRASPRR